MRKLGIAGGVAATLLGATAVMAASPSAPASSGATTAPATPAAAATTATTAAATADPWSATVKPLTLQGTAAFDKHSNGGATLSMKMQGLDPMARWTVTIVPRADGAFATRPVLFQWTVGELDRLNDGTLSVHLTDAEFDSIAHARTTHGFDILVSDGSRDALATFPKA